MRAAIWLPGLAVAIGAAVAIAHGLADARRLLVETDLPVNEIGRRVGLEDPAYFARSFRRAHGLTAREWRGTTGRS